MSIFNMPILLTLIAATISAGGQVALKYAMLKHGSIEALIH
jgi:hypothetical protein